MAPPYRGRNSDRGGKNGSSKRRVCFKMQNTGRCRYGASCKYTHDMNRSGGQNVEPEQRRQPPARSKAMDDYNSWKRIIKQAPVRNDLGTMKRMWSDALNILNDSNRDIQQMLPRDLDDEELLGREHIRALLVTQSVSAQHGTFFDLVLPFIQVMTHQSLLNCLSVDTYVGGLYNFFCGTNGSRAIPFLRRCIDSLIQENTDHTPIDPAQTMETRVVPVLIILHETLTKERRALFNEDLPGLVDLIEVAGGVICHDRDIVVHQIMARHIRNIRSMIARATGALLHPEVQEAGDDPETTTMSTYPREMEIPSGRHDNDRMDIADIRILPTEDEIRCDSHDFLPSTDFDKPHFLNDEGQRHLDTHFRLLRHDIFGELKDTLGNLMAMVEESPDVLMASSPNLGNVRAYTYPQARVSYLGIDGKRGLEARISFPQMSHLRKKSTRDRHTWWEGSKRLEESTLLCLLFIENEKSSILLLTVSGKETDPHKEASLASDGYHATISAKLAVTDQAHVERLAGLSRNKTQCMLVELPGVLLSTILPILEDLQGMQRSSRLPFRDWILPQAGRAQNILSVPPPMYARRAGFSFGLRPILKDDGADIQITSSTSVDDESVISEIERRTGLDIGQCRALVAALTREYALIQGPPGTGKSYLGVQLMKVLSAQRHTADLGPIIVVCYTNHALDQFLEHPIEVGIQKIIRIGGQSRSKVLEGKNLRIVSREESKTRSEGGILGQTYAMIKESEEGTSKLLKDMHRRNQTEWSHLGRLLKREYPDIYAQFREVDSQGWELAGRHPFDVWNDVRGMPIPNLVRAADVERLIATANLSVYAVNVQDRSTLVNYWARELFEEQTDDLFESVKRFESDRRQLANVHDEIDRRVLQTADVIGVTTTGLARRIDVLQKVQSKVTICEEAGEVLEAHMISALLPSVEHFIQIGDHQQLRPQVNNYKLSLEGPHKTNYQLDRSQFERLALGDTGAFPIAQLNVQRRMRPEVSTLIRQTIYPRLIDHKVTKSMPDVLGMRNNVSWLDHDNIEDSQNADIQQKSHANAWEVDMVHALVRHIVRQGTYKSDEIAVLTPYTGQLQRLRAKLREDFEVVVSERDQEELAKSGFDVETPSNSQNETSLTPVSSNRKPLEKKRLSELLRVATVDNFQGEEAKIIIVSLVRSNKAKKVGFLRTTNRINVLLSRAQHGMFLIGNAHTYSNVPMWEKVIGMLRATDSVSTSLGLCCPRHVDTVIEARQPEDFTRLSPEGGCRLPCERRLEACGHQCQARCHSESMHQAFACQQPCRRLHSPCGHACQKSTCGEPCGSCMIKIDDVKLPCSHEQDQVHCYKTQDVGSISCRTEVTKVVPDCGHEVQVLCPTDVGSAPFSCPVACGELLRCGHPCTGACSQCRTRTPNGSIVIKHQPCSKTCGRPLGTCNHVCKKRCHDGTHCGDCTSRCEVRCSHSKCDRQCREPCAPCIQDCTWNFEHQGSCSLPCAAPCDRLPCDKRCTLSLACGHRCPGLCGETCPEDYCQVCSTKQDDRVDLLEMKLYREISLNEAPIVVLGCGHFFTYETLDGLVGLSEVYVENNTGAFVDLKDISNALASSIPRCPDCQGPIRQHVTQRYNRVINRAVIDEMSKRFLVRGKARLHELEVAIGGLEESLEVSRPNFLYRVRQTPFGTGHSSSNINDSLIERYKHPETLEKKITALLKEVSDEFQPAKKLHDAVRTANAKPSLDRLMADLSLVQVDFDIPRDRRVMLSGQAAELKVQHTILFDKFAIFKELASRSMAAEVKIPGGAVDLAARAFFRNCRTFFNDCVANSLPKLAVEACIYYANIARVYQGSARSFTSPIDITTPSKYIEITKELLEKSEQLCSSPFQDADIILEAVQELAKALQGDRYEVVTAEEIAAIKAAMVSGRGGIATHAGHWYNCVNGHPFAIGECGMPMEQARCPECGAAVGGQHHRPAEGVTRATEME